MTYTIERRQSPRKRFEDLLYVELERGNGGMVLNLSEHGFGVRAVKRVRPKEEVKFSFNLDEKRRVEGCGRLEWADKEGRVAGVQYTDVSDDFLKEMRKWMANAVEYPFQNTEVSPSSPVPSDVNVAQMSTSDHSKRTEATALTAEAESNNGHDRAAQTGTAKSVRSITSAPSNAASTVSPAVEPSVPPVVAFPLMPETPTESVASEGSKATSKNGPSGGTWASLPPAVGSERKPLPPVARKATQASDFSAATAHKLEPVDQPDVEYTDLSGDFELAEEMNADAELATPSGALSGQYEEHRDPLASLEERTARALNEHAQALLQHFQHEEQRTLATFREAAARVLRDSERQLFPVRESVQAQMKSLESAVASAGASVKVLDRYPALLERAQQQALERFQSQVQEILLGHVTEMRRRSETVLAQIGPQAKSEGLMPGRIKTSSGIIVTVILVMLLVGLFVFRREVATGFIWLGQQMVEPAAPASSEPAKTEPAKTSPVESVKPPVQENKPATEETQPPLAESQPAEKPEAAPAESRIAPQQPVSRAQTVKSLWDEVAKGNVTAELTLGNMYFTGHGVTRNCYQARRLFAAATRKGSMEGKQKLAELDRSNCPVVAP